MMIEIQEHPGWTEARCPSCPETVAIFGATITAEETRAGIMSLIAHARACPNADHGYPPQDPSTAKLLARLMHERYPTMKG